MKNDIKNMNNSSKALKAGVWLIISNFIAKGIAFFTMPFFTRIMTKSDIGSFSNISSWLNILAIITTFELYSSINLAKFDYKENLNKYISSNLFFGTIITSIFYIIILMFPSFFQDLLMMDMSKINLIFIYLLIQPSIQMLQVKNRITYNYKVASFISISSAILSSFISLVCVLMFEDKLQGRIYGFYVPLIIISLIVYLKLIFDGKSISRKYWKYAFNISFPLIWHLLAGTLLNSSDKIMLAKMVGVEANALYTTAYTCSMIISILWSSMNSAWSPWAFEMLEEKKYQKLRQASKPYFLFFLGITLTFMIFAPELLYIMGGKGYISAVYIIPPVMIGYVFQFVYSLYVNIEYYQKKQKYIAIGTIIVSIVNIGLNFIFIPIFGYIAAAYTTLIGYILLFLIHYSIVKKLGYSNCYDIRFFKKYLLLILSLILVLNFIYKYLIIKYILTLLLFLILIIVIIKKRKELFQIFKTRDIKIVINMFTK